MKGTTKKTQENGGNKNRPHHPNFPASLESKNHSSFFSHFHKLEAYYIAPNLHHKSITYSSINLSLSLSLKMEQLRLYGGCSFWEVEQLLLQVTAHINIYICPHTNINPNSANIYYYHFKNLKAQYGNVSKMVFFFFFSCVLNQDL